MPRSEERQARLNQLAQQLRERGYQVVDTRGTAPPLIAASDELRAVAIYRGGTSKAKLRRRYRHWPHVIVRDAPRRPGLSRREIRQAVQHDLEGPRLDVYDTENKVPNLLAHDPHERELRGVHVVAVTNPSSWRRKADLAKRRYAYLDHVAIHTPHPHPNFPVEPELGISPNTSDESIKQREG